MRSFVLFGLLALILSTVYAGEKRVEKRFRKFSSFPLKDKRGTNYFPSHTPIGGHTSGLYQSFTAGNSGHSFTGIPGSYQGLSQLSAGHSTTFLPLTSSSNSEKNGLSSMGLSLGKHNGLSIVALPVSTPMFSSTSKTGPITFAIQSGSSENGKTGYMNPIHAAGIQGLSAYSTGGTHLSNFPYMNMGAHAFSYNVPIGSSNIAAPSISPSYTGSSGGSHSYSLPLSSRGVSGGLVFAENPHNPSLSYNRPSPAPPSHGSPSSPTYHIGLSSGSADSSSYHLPISHSEYPIESSASHPRYHQSPVSSAGSSYGSPNTQVYSLPNTNYGISSNSYSTSYVPTSSSNPSAHYSSSSSTDSSPYSSYNSVTPSHSSPTVSYASPSSSYSVSSEYPNDSQTSTAYGSPEQQGSYSNISPMYLNQISVKSHNNDETDFPKYDTISYSSHNGKY